MRTEQRLLSLKEFRLREHMRDGSIAGARARSGAHGTEALRQRLRIRRIRDPDARRLAVCRFTPNIVLLAGNKRSGYRDLVYVPVEIERAGIGWLFDKAIYTDPVNAGCYANVPGQRRGLHAVYK